MLSSRLKLWILAAGCASAFILVLATLVFLSYRQRATSQPLAILMYHVIEDSHESLWCVPPDTFKKQIRFLYEQGYKTILPSDLVAHQAWGKPIPRKSLILTFDDGYLSNLKIVEPILKRYGFRGIIYLITKYVAEHPEQRQIFHGIDCLSWQEIGAMQKRGTFAFGAHSHTHANLAALKNPLPEIEKSYQQIVKHGLPAPDSFCYPYGQFNNKTIEAVRTAGFTTGMICKDKLAYTGREINLFALPRISVIGGHHQFIAKVQFKGEKSNHVIYQVSHRGVPIEVSPELVFTNRALNALWLPSKQMNNEQVEWRWLLPDEIGKKEPFQLQIWDKYRIFPLYIDKIYVTAHSS